MQKVIAYPFPLFTTCCLEPSWLFFHVIQWYASTCSGIRSQEERGYSLFFPRVEYLRAGKQGNRIRGLEKLPTDTPLIIAANHQSWYDITTIGWFMRKVHPKFVSKIELGKGIPSISYNLRHGGSALIDRKDGKQAIAAIRQLALYIEEHKRSAVIFPEGTRSKTGKPGPFAENGLKILCKYAPSALVVPVTINNSWKMTRWSSFPLGIGNKIEFIIHDPIPVEEIPFPALL